MRRATVKLGVLFVALAVARTAVADGAPPSPICTQPSPADARALAETLFFTARGLMEAGRYGEAALKLAESYRLDPAAGTLLNLAVCHEKEGKIATAWGEFRQALAEARHAGRADREEFASTHIKEIEPELSYLTIEVPADVQVHGLEIVRNGVILQAATWSTELPVDPGTVEIVARAERFLPNKTTLSVAKREHRTVTVERLALAPVHEAPVSFWTGRRQAGAVAAAGGLALLGVGIGFGVATLTARSHSDSECPTFDGERRCTQAGVDEMQKAKTYAIVSDVGLGLGAVGLAAGAYLFFSRGGRGKEAPRAADATTWHGGFDAGPTGARGYLQRSF